MKRLIYFLPFLGLLSCTGADEKADAYGNFEAQEVNIATQVPGKIITAVPQEGSTVEANQLLFWIDTVQFHINKQGLFAKKAAIQTKVSTINAQIKVYETQLEVMEKEVNRIQKLVAGKAATQKQLDDLEGQVRIIKEQKQAAKTQLNSIYKEAEAIDFQVSALNNQIENAEVTSPISGKVLMQGIEQGEVVAPGKVLMKIANLEKLDLRVYFSGDQLNDIQIGNEVEVQYDDTKETNSSTTGKITWISDKAEFTPKIIQTKEERVNMVYAAKVEVENSGVLKIGMPGEVYLKTAN